MPDRITFTVFAKPQPQGSMKGFVLPGKNGAKARAILTSDNSKLKPYRGEVTREAMLALGREGIKEPFADKHVAVGVEMRFYFSKPPSISKKRTNMVVKPDLDKICRSTIDAITGTMFTDDAQIVYLKSSKEYGVPERVEIVVSNFYSSFPVSSKIFDESGLGKL